MADGGDAAKANVEQLADGANAIAGKRSNELKKIQALKMRLKNLKAEHSLSEGAGEEEAEALRAKCENLLNLTKRITDGIHSKLEAEKEEMELYRDAALRLLSEEESGAGDSVEEKSAAKEEKESESTTGESTAVVSQQKERISRLEEEVREREAEVETLKKKNEEVTASLKEIAEEAAENAEALVNLQMAELTRISSEEYNTVEDLKIALERERLAANAERKKVAELNAELARLKATVAEAEVRTLEAQSAAADAVAAAAESSRKREENSPPTAADCASEEEATAAEAADSLEGSAASLEGRLLASPSSSVDSQSSLDLDILTEARMARHYLNKLKLLEATFETDELLAKALYQDLGAEAIDKPQRLGFLTKQGGAVKSWKRRYFVLKDNFLFYYKRVKDDAPIGVIQLEAGCAEEAAPGEIDKKNCFKLKTKTRVWWLHAERQIEMDIWIECIKNLSSWYENPQLRQPTVMKLRNSSAPSSPAGPVRATKKASKSFRLSTYLVTPSPK